MGSKYCSDECRIEWVMKRIDETEKRQKPVQHIATEVVVNFE